MYDAYICGSLRRTKIIRKASDAVLSPEIVMHEDTHIGGRSENNIKCIMHDDLG